MTEETLKCPFCEVELEEEEENYKDTFKTCYVCPKCLDYYDDYSLERIQSLKKLAYERGYKKGKEE